MFSPWYENVPCSRHDIEMYHVLAMICGWIITHLALNNNHSLHSQNKTTECDLVWRFLCDHKQIWSGIILCCYRRPRQSVHRMVPLVDRSFWNFEHNELWHWIKVGIGMGYGNHVSFQTRCHKVKKWMFLSFVHGEFIFHLSVTISA
jgi:hypothetical protein